MGFFNIVLREQTNDLKMPLINFFWYI